ncbi:MAG: hypothetical protein AB2693_13320, partial [Candidatus Thiodiazotropha sp.]
IFMQKDEKTIREKTKQLNNTMCPLGQNNEEKTKRRHANECQNKMGSFGVASTFLLFALKFRLFCVADSVSSPLEYHFFSPFCIMHFRLFVWRFSANRQNCENQPP